MLHNTSDSYCVGDFSIWESRMIDEAHLAAIDVGKARNMHECATKALDGHPLAYMATMSNPLHPSASGLSLHDCFAVITRLDGESNRLVRDPLFISCFLKG